ncbi:type III-B CRISPR-associated protein Cas10/Cmr2 [Desulfoscipio sp. XC116]|uniref:type III-B CRISPR-associated protein Cas10/Cmr2 n=1 Tax=Desulfoscipio sp. XC116 TaxID=3144975 RepID=UPI00325B6C74
MADKSLFVFTIGPVQSFISQARKARDLYAGSFLLSYLMGRVIEVLSNYDQKHIEIVFPAVINGEYNIPNRVVAVVLDYNNFQKRALGNVLEEQTRNLFRQIGDEILKKLGLTISEAYKEQIQQQLEMYWLFQDYEDYQTGYREMVNKLNEIKRLRRFQQITEAAGRKCTLNPDKNIIFYSKPLHFVNRQKAILFRHPAYPYALEEREGLSAVAFIKRMLFVHQDIQKTTYQKDFPSVLEIPLRSRLKEESEKKLLQQLGPDSGSVVFDLYNGLRPQQAAKQINTEKEKAAAAIIQYIKSREKALKKPFLSSYYALVKFDGDDMGTLYREARIHKDTDYKEFQKRLSEELCQFAAYVKRGITEEEGAVIYAGGEDFLGLLALDTLFDVLIRLRRKFAQIDMKEYLDKTLSFSAGIAVAHIKTPLKQVIAKADEMEHFAKEIDADKDAFALAVMKRSGEEVKTRLKFGQDISGLDEIHKLVKVFQTAQISNSFGYGFNSFLTEFAEVDTGLKDAMVKCELERQLMRSETEGDPSVYAKDIFRFYKHYDSIHSFMDALNVVMFLAREVV